MPRNAPRAPLPQPSPSAGPPRSGCSPTSSDGRLRTLAEQRNRVVVLYFWNISESLSVSHLPVLAQIRSEFEPRGVFFLAIHGPGQDENLVRGSSNFKSARSSGRWTLDRQASTVIQIGATAWRYGFQSAPLVVGIDKGGKVAFRDDRRGWSPKPPFDDDNKQPRPGHTEEAMNELFKKELAWQIQRILDRND